MHSAVYFGPGFNSTNGVVSAGFNNAKSAECLSTGLDMHSA